MLTSQILCFAIIGTCLAQSGGDKTGGSKNGIENHVEQYFASDVVKQFKLQWEPQRKTYEAAIRAALYEQIGRRSMNMYLKSDQVKIPLEAGFLLTDNVIDLLIVNTTLRDIPEPILPEVSLHLSKNVLQLDTTLRKMFLDGTYACFRNKSTVLFNEGAQSLLANSPFSFDQVSNEGQVTIIAENCLLEGSAVVTLIGYSVNVGYSGFELNDCKFSIEISNRGLGNDPPVIVPYFSQSQRNQLQQILNLPVMKYVTEVLQGVLFSHMNTTSIIGDELMKYRHVQGKIFQKTSEFMVKTIAGLNKGTVIKNQGRLNMDDYFLTWDDKFAGNCPRKGTTFAKLYNMSVSGLDTAYSTNTGGPYEADSWKISELIAFNRLYVKGSFNCNSHNGENITLVWAAEIPHLGVSVTIGNDEDKVDEKKAATTKNKFSVRNWKVVEFYIFDMEVNEVQRNYIRAFVNGYLLNTLPDLLIAHLEELFQKAVDGGFDAKDLPLPVTPENDHKIDSCEARGYEKPTNQDSNTEDVTESGGATGDDKEGTTQKYDDSGDQLPTARYTSAEKTDVEKVQNEIR